MFLWLFTHSSPLPIFLLSRAAQQRLVALTEIVDSGAPEGFKDHRYRPGMLAVSHLRFSPLGS